MNRSILDFYTQHSPYTDPGKFAPRFNDLPADPPAIVRAIQGLIIAPYDYALQPRNLHLEDIKDAAFGIRVMEQFIAKLLSISEVPLEQPRPPRLRLGVNCRNFATLLVAILRHKGIAARERVGFEGYLGGKIHYEHRIAEYWHARQGRWLRADAMVDPLLKVAQRISVDTLDIGPGDPFFTAAEVWLRSRAGSLNPLQFGDSEIDIGLPPIRYALLHDFDALNKFEVRGDDAWGELIEKPEDELTADDLRFLDEVARLTCEPDANLDLLLALHTESQYGREVRAAALHRLNS